MQKKMRSFVGVLLAMVLVFGSTFPSVAADQLYMEPEEEMGISLKEAGIDEIEIPLERDAEGNIIGGSTTVDVELPTPRTTVAARVTLSLTFGSKGPSWTSYQILADVNVLNPMDPSDMVSGVKATNLRIWNASYLNNRDYWSGSIRGSWPAGYHGSATVGHFSIDDDDSVEKVRLDTTGLMVLWLDVGYISATEIHGMYILPQ